jgi:hypothetical protein
MGYINITITKEFRQLQKYIQQFFVKSNLYDKIYSIFLFLRIILQRIESNEKAACKKAEEKNIESTFNPS